MKDRPAGSSWPILVNYYAVTSPDELNVLKRLYEPGQVVSGFHKSIVTGLQIATLVEDKDLEAAAEVWTNPNLEAPVTWPMVAADRVKLTFKETRDQKTPVFFIGLDS
jgi:hypothetical protein